MPDEYTPTTEEVRQTYGDARCPDADDPRHKTDICPGDAEFNRWLAEHDAAVRAEQAEEDADLADEAAKRSAALRKRSAADAERTLARGLRRRAQVLRATPKEGEQ